MAVKQRYWAKSGDPCHLVQYHNLDVAACGLTLLREQAGFRRRLAQLSGVPEELLLSFLPSLLALHDVGKFSPSFQALDNCWQRLTDSLGQPPEYSRDHRHDLLGLWLWQQALEPIYLGPNGLPGATWPDANWTLERWLDSIFGHHGRPLAWAQLRHATDYFRQQDIAAAVGFAEEIVALPELDFRRWSEPVHASLERLNSSSWLVAGWAALSDWLGSNEYQFVRREEWTDLAEYWSEVALPTALRAVRAAGVVTPNQLGKGFESIFPGWKATPMQQWANSVEICEQPTLSIIEDATGSGKTEAALVMASRIGEVAPDAGVYIGLPTMATANGIYSRMEDIYARLFENEQPSLVLAHGGRRLDDRFRASVTRSQQPSPQPNDDGPDEPSESICAAWFANSTKTALIAPFGVGTIDQAMLGVLPATHQAMRMFGLAGKTVIVDEVHAYDPYMLEVIGTLLEFLRSSGSHVILLSATLPNTVRSFLVERWGAENDFTPSDSYPLVTTVTDTAADEPIAPAGEGRVLTFEIVDQETRIWRYLTQHLTNNQTCCWIRNTVDDAIEAYERAIELLGAEKVLLFHARFAVEDRQRIENKVLALYGKRDRPDEARGTLVIATQVIEQSLDLDFDAMVTDLAPIDLVLQRAGRFRRHKRSENGELSDEEGRNTTSLVVYGPAPTPTPDPNWYADVFPRAKWVYPDVAKLWLTARYLGENQTVEVPAENRRAVEFVYGDEHDAIVPAAFETATIEATTDALAAQSTAQFGTLRLSEGYCRNAVNGLWVDETRAVTRLGPPTQTFRLVVERGGRQVPLSANERFGWEMSELSIRASLGRASVAPTGWSQAAVKRFKEQQPDKFRFSEPLFVQRRGEEFFGSLIRGESTTDIVYSRTTGLRKIKEEE